MVCQKTRDSFQISASWRIRMISIAVRLEGHQWGTFQGAPVCIRSGHSRQEGCPAEATLGGATNVTLNMHSLIFFRLVRRLVAVAPRRVFFRRTRSYPDSSEGQYHFKSFIRHIDTPNTCIVTIRNNSAQSKRRKGCH